MALPFGLNLEYTFHQKNGHDNERYAMDNITLASLLGCAPQHTALVYYHFLSPLNFQLCHFLVCLFLLLGKNFPCKFISSKDGPIESMETRQG